MIKVAALTSGVNVPSTRFRVRQHIGPLREAGVCVREYMPLIDKYSPLPRPLDFSGRWGFSVGHALWKCVKAAAALPGLTGSWRAQITWLSRGILPGVLVFEPILRRPYILDVDDAIWCSPPFGRFAMKQIARNAQVVLAGNSYIADWFSPYAGDVRIVPTAVDTDLIRPRKASKNGTGSESYTVGWIGTSSNYASLYRIEKSLEQFLRHHQAQFLIVCDQPPKFVRLPPEKLRYVKWSPDEEVKALHQMDIGLMPLLPDEWSLGKCSFKMLQYMAAGLPVIVSPIGMNTEVLAMGRIGLPAVSDADWYEALAIFFSDPSLGYQCGRMGRSIVERNFSRSVISATLVGIFNEVGQMGQKPK